MKRYEKPMVLVSEDLVEGVYLASGSSTLSLECEDCDYFVFNQPVNVQVIGGKARTADRYAAAGYDISPENSWVVSIDDKGQQYAKLLVTAKEEGHGPVRVVDQGSAHGWKS